MKTPETEASGVSILTILQYNRLSRPPAPPAVNLQLPLPLLPLAAPASRTFGLRLPLSTPARPAADSPGSDRRGFAQLDRWRTPDSHRVLRASDRPMAIHPACAERSLHRQGRRSTADSHRILILQLGWWNNLRLSPAVVAASSLRWLPPQPPAFTGCCLPGQTGGEPPTRIGCSTSGFTGFDSPGLRPAFLPPAGPLMRP